MTAPEVVQPDAFPCTVEGDVAARGGPHRWAAGTRVTGSIREGADVVAAGALRVEGAIEGSTVSASGPLMVAGGVLGHGKGRCFAAGPITLKFAGGVHLESDGDITAEAEIATSSVFARGTIRCETGSIFGGRISALRGVSAAVLGSVAGTPTVVEPGSDFRLRSLARERVPAITRDQLKAAAMRAEAATLMSRQKELTPQQKEHATELAYEAEELESSVVAAIAELKRAAQASAEAAVPEIVAHRAVHAGVTIRFPTVEFVADREYPGPVRLTPAPGSTPGVVMTNLETGDARPLKAARYADPDLAALHELLNLGTKSAKLTPVRTTA